MKLSDSTPYPTEAFYLVMGEDNKHLQDPQAPSIYKKDDSLSLDLSKTSDGDTNKVSQPCRMSQDLAASEVRYTLSIYQKILSFTT